MKFLYYKNKFELNLCVVYKNGFFIKKKIKLKPYESANMERNNTLDRMATYDFKAPINIVYFEENSDEEIDLTSSPKSKEVEKNEVHTEIDLINTEIYSVFDKNLEKIESNTNDNIRKQKSPSETKKSEKDNGNSKDNSTTIDSLKIPMTLENVNTIDKETDSLKTISKYLTIILESFYRYKLIASNKYCSPEQLSVSKINYLNVKYHYFVVGYEQFNTHILPNENNQAFIHNFLSYTTDVASNRIKMDCRNGITEIYFEMMKWVKQKKLKDFSDSSKTPILLKQLNNPPLIPNISISESMTNIPQHFSNGAAQGTSCIFSSGPSAKQSNINVDKSIIPNNCKVLRNTRLPQRQLTKQNLNTQHTLSNKTSPIGMKFNNLENNFGNRQFNGELTSQQNDTMHSVVPANRYVVIDENRVPHYIAPPNHLMNTNEYNQAPNSNFNYYHTTNNFQNNNYFSANNFAHGTSYVPNQQDDGIFRIYGRDHQPRPNVRVPPPPYHSAVAMHPNQITQPLTTAPTTTILHGPSSGPDLTRSSISADSGFVSPVTSKSSTHSIEEIMNDIYELENIVEPAKEEPAKAFCYVCHKKATLMCSACFKTTYCNAKCQRVDWKTHKLFCLSSTEKRSQ